MVLCIAAMLATMSVCSAQSIEVDELTDAALQIDGTVIYVYGTELDNTVRVQPHPTLLNRIRVQILDLDDWMFGGPGDDEMTTGFGRSLLFGEEDDDTITGDIEDTA